MNNLSGCLIREHGVHHYFGEMFYWFSIIFTGKSKHFFVKDQVEAKNWTKSLRTALNYKNFFEFYELIDDLSKGHFGLVKLGVDLKTREKVAIKIIKKKAFSERELHLVQTEISVMKLCKFPFIVKFKEHFENSEFIFVVMEYLPYGNLLEYLRNTNCSISRRNVKRIALQVASALNYLHCFGIVHRDVKLENIMISHQGNNFFVKLLDFGLSKILGPNETANEKCGTLHYIAPEIYKRESYNEKVDVWSFGVLLYFLMCSHFPFNSLKEKKREVIERNIVYEPLELKGSSWKKFPESAIGLLKKCLQKDPSLRFSAQEILECEWLGKEDEDEDEDEDD